MPRAKAAALQALSDDAESAEAHLRLAQVLHWYDWEWAQAEAEYRRVIELNAGLPDPHYGIAEELVHIGRIEEAVAHARTAIELDPLAPHGQRILSTVSLLGGRVDDALSQAQDTLDLDPSYVPAYWALAGPHMAAGRYDEARTACEQGLALAKDDPILLGSLGFTLGMMGRREEAERRLEQLLRRRRDGYFSPLLIAGCCLGLGRNDESIEWLQKAVDERDGMCPILNEWPIVDPLRSDPRFQALLQRMNFPAQPQS